VSSIVTIKSNINNTVITVRVRIIGIITVLRRTTSSMFICACFMYLQMQVNLMGTGVLVKTLTTQSTVSNLVSCLRTYIGKGGSSFSYSFVLFYSISCVQSFDTRMYMYIYIYII